MILNDRSPASAAVPDVRRWVLIALAVLAVGWFDLWTLQADGRDWKFGVEQDDYYNLLIDGWLDGHLHMKVDVPAELLKLRDPYDPSQRPPGIWLHDASFYRGKYYLYFGAAPAVVLMLPFRVLTGVDLPVAFATLAFVYGGFLASAAIWLQIRRRFFAETGIAVAVLGILVLGIASLAPILLRRAQMWELPIAAGYCFAMLALWAMLRSLHAKRSRTRWLAVAATLLGLATGSRPTYLFAAPLLIIPLVVWWREERRMSWLALASVVVPLTAIGCLMALHNTLRFGSPLEFGQAYQFTSYDETKVPHFSPRYATFNGWRYFFSRAQWSPWFPFVAPAELPPKPAGFSGHDDVYGVLANMPFGWLALLAPLALLRRSTADRLRLGAWLGAVAGLFAVMASLLLCFFGSLARYEVDFAPSLMLLAGVGVLAIERLCATGAAIGHRLVRAAWVGAAIFAMIFALLFTLQYDGRLQRYNPAKADALARALNWIPYACEQLAGIKHGGVELDLLLHPKPTGDETLLTLGDSPQLDRVLVRHVDLARVQFVVALAGMPEIASRPVGVDFARSHTLRLRLGALLPPETHPMFRQHSAAEQVDMTRQVQLEFDGETLLDERREFAPGLRKLRVGREAMTEPASRFAGEIRAVRQIGAEAPKPAEWLVRLRLAFPSAAFAMREPLLGFQAVGGGVLFVRYVDDAGQVAFGTSVGGARDPESDPVTIDMARVHELTVRGWPAAGPGGQRLELRLDGAIAWSREVRWPAAKEALVVGRNPGNEPGCAGAFSGWVHSVQRALDGRDPLVAASGDVLRLRVRFPLARKGTRDPLVVTGRSGAGDLLFVEYVDDHTIRFALDHWGGAMLSSEPVPVDFTVPHEITVATTALSEPTVDAPLRMARKGAVRIELDGRLVWHAPVQTFVARPDEISIGANPIGGTSATGRFGGDILAVERVTRGSAPR